MVKFLLQKTKALDYMNEAISSSFKIQRGWNNLPTLLLFVPYYMKDLKSHY